MAAAVEQEGPADLRALGVVEQHAEALGAQEVVAEPVEHVLCWERATERVHARIGPGSSSLILFTAPLMHKAGL